MTSDVRTLTAELNRTKRKAGHRRANSNVCRLLADAVRESGDERLADIWQRVADLLDSWGAAKSVGEGDTWAGCVLSPVFYAVDAGKFIDVYRTDGDYPWATRGWHVGRVRKSTGEVYGPVQFNKHGWAAWTWDRRGQGNVLELINPPSHRYRASRRKRAGA